MANYVYNKVTMPKEVFLEYFCTNQETKDYDLEKLADGTMSARYPIYYSKMPYVEFGEMVTIYFDNRWQYPIDSIISLFKRAKKPAQITWYCCEENDIYVSKFFSKGGRLQEEVLILENDKEYDRLLGEYLEREDTYDRLPDFTELIWYYHPEIRWGWQKLDSNNILIRHKEDYYGSDDLEYDRVFPPAIFEDQNHTLKLLIEGYTPLDERPDDGRTDWTQVSWLFYDDNNGCHSSERAEILASSEVDEIHKMLGFLMAGKYERCERIGFSRPGLEFAFYPGKKPRVELTLVRFYNSDYEEKCKFTFSKQNLVMLVKYFDKVTGRKESEG